MFGLALIAPEFVPLALREQWTDCVPYLQVLCVAGATIPVSQQFSNLLVSRGRSSKFFIGTAGMMAAQLAIILGLYLTGHGVHTLICSIAALQIAWMGVWFGMTRSEIRISTTDTLRDILLYAISSEKDSLLFYLEMLTETQSETLKPVLREIIAEEKKHLYDLQALLEKLG